MRFRSVTFTAAAWTSVLLVAYTAHDCDCVFVTQAVQTVARHVSDRPTQRWTFWSAHLLDFWHVMNNSSTDSAHFPLICGRHSFVVLLTWYERRLNKFIHNVERATQSDNRFVFSEVVGCKTELKTQFVIANTPDVKIQPAVIATCFFKFILFNIRYSVHDTVVGLWSVPHCKNYIVQQLLFESIGLWQPVTIGLA